MCVGLEHSIIGIAHRCAHVKTIVNPFIYVGVDDVDDAMIDVYIHSDQCRKCEKDP